MDRRTFLQASLTAAAAGGAWWLLGPTRSVQGWARTLAAPTARKLALLVGVNRYGEGAALNLKGCLTDVELQRELLIGRFGFKPADIVTLTDGEATRQGIEEAFLEHLAAQARAGDVVVFHFSGYGSEVNPAPPAQGSLKSLVPSDGRVPTPGAAGDNDLLEDTLRLLGQCLVTDKLTVVLDVSHSPGEGRLRGNWPVRSFPKPAGSLNPEALAFQEELRGRIAALSPTGKGAAKKLAPLGTVLAAAAPEQVAVEVTGKGFSAGLFTYALTQYLWQVTPASKATVALRQAAEQIAPVLGGGQQPQRRGGGKPSLFAYYLLPETPAGAEGTVTAVPDRASAELKLTGLPLTVLEGYGLHSCFTVPGAEGVILQLESREGLTARARQLAAPDSPAPSLGVGQPVQEWLRILPRQLKLAVALDADLDRIERVDATSALANLAAVSAVVEAGEQAADCVLGKVRPPAPGGYGLFSSGGVPIPHTAGAATEAIKSAIDRLTPQLDQWLAVKWWRLTENGGSSRLGVRVTLEPEGKALQPPIQRQTWRQGGKLGGRAPAIPGEAASEGLPRLERGSRLQYRLENLSDRPIYFLLLGTDARGKAIAYYCPQMGADSPGERPCILPGEAAVVPSPTAGFHWIVPEARGLVQVQAICSRSPLRRTSAAIAGQEAVRPDRAQLLPLRDPLAVAEALLQDLHAASAARRDLLGSSSADVYALDVRAWATLSFVYQVV